MKTNFIAKHKWWALTALLAVVLMAVSVSYCAWDTLSAKASLSGGSGRYEKFSYSYTDRNNNKKLDNSDLITGFGEFNMVVVETYNDYYMVITEGIVDTSVYASSGSTEYITSDIRARLNTVFLSKYSVSQQNLIISRTELSGDKIWLMSKDEVQTGYFAIQANREMPTWWVLRTPYSYLTSNDRVGMVSANGRLNESPNDDLASTLSNYRFGMFLRK